MYFDRFFCDENGDFVIMEINKNNKDMMQCTAQTILKLTFHVIR